MPEGSNIEQINQLRSKETEAIALDIVEYGTSVEKAQFGIDTFKEAFKGLKPTNTRDGKISEFPLTFENNGTNPWKEEIDSIPLGNTRLYSRMIKEGQMAIKVVVKGESPDTTMVISGIVDIDDATGQPIYEGSLVSARKENEFLSATAERQDESSVERQKRLTEEKKSLEEERLKLNQGLAEYNEAHNNLQRDLEGVRDTGYKIRVKIAEEAVNKEIEKDPNQELFSDNTRLRMIAKKMLAESVDSPEEQVLFDNLRESLNMAEETIQLKRNSFMLPSVEGRLAAVDLQLRESSNAVNEGLDIHGVKGFRRSKQLEKLHRIETEGSTLLQDFENGRITKEEYTERTKRIHGASLSKYHQQREKALFDRMGPAERDKHQQGKLRLKYEDKRAVAQEYGEKVIVPRVEDLRKERDKIQIDIVEEVEEQLDPVERELELKKLDKEKAGQIRADLFTLFSGTPETWDSDLDIDALLEHYLKNVDPIQRPALEVILRTDLKNRLTAHLQALRLSIPRNKVAAFDVRAKGILKLDESTVFEKDPKTPDGIQNRNSIAIELITRALPTSGEITDAEISALLDVFLANSSPYVRQTIESGVRAWIKRNRKKSNSRNSGGNQRR